MKLVLASRNRGKLVELRDLLGPLGVEVLSLDEVGWPAAAELPEEGDTFEANAESKARAVLLSCGLPVLGDDSGLEVDALGGAPGVRSARYAEQVGESADRNQANIDKLLSAMAGVGPGRRGARFVCCLVCLMPDGQRRVACGICEGSILEQPRGTGGFGYDPVFMPEGTSRTMAELSLEEKNRLSHRARALRVLGRVFERTMPGAGEVIEPAPQAPGGQQPADPERQ